MRAAWQESHNATGRAFYSESAMNAFSASLNETHAIVGSCISCTTPANLIATLALILIGVGLAAHHEGRRKMASADPAAGPVNYYVTFAEL
jgi:hypothetical protein